MGGGGGGGGGVWYSLFIKTIYSLKVRKVAKKSDYSLFINFLSLFIFFFGSFTIHYKKGPLFTNHYTPSRPSWHG